MKKYKEYVKRLCTLLLVCALIISQDLMPVHALNDNTTVTESTENEIDATAGENTEAINGGQIEAQTPENSAENPVEEEIIPDDKLLPEETTEDEIMPADAGTTADLYPEGNIHVNPSDTEKTDPLGNTVTVKPGNNTTGDGSLAKPYYSLGKAYKEVAVPGEGETTEKNIYVHSSVIVSGEEAGTDENGTDIVTSTGAVKSATYFAEDKKLVVNQADDLDALFTVIGGTLIFQNMTVKMMDEVLAKGAELRIALSGGKAVLGKGLNVPNDKFYFSVNETVGGTKDETPDVAPIQVDQVPNTDGDKIPVVVSGDLVKNYTNYKKSSDEIEKTTTQEWKVKIPIAIAANRDDLNNVILKGIGSIGNMVYSKFTTEEKNGEVSAESSETLEVREWNTPLTFTTEENAVYLTGYHKVESTVTRAAATTQTVDMILKRPGIYYVDGTKGNDANKGTCPDEALKTLEKAYEKLDADAANPEITSRGGIIYIVENVDLTGTITIKEDGDASVMTAGSSTYNTQGDVIIRRYSKPTTQKQGYTTGTNNGTMFTIADTAKVSIQGVTIDGHSQKLDSTDDTLAAEGVTNADAIFSVNGNLTLGSGEAVTKNTLVQNNDASGKNGGLIRVERTGNLYLTGDMPKEADLEEGQAAVYGTRLSGGKAANGNAIYADLGETTEMKLAHGAKADYPEIDGSIYLTGNKTTIATESDKYSSFVTIADGTAGAITDNRYEFEVQDAYNGRLVVSYPTGTTLSAADVKGYTVNGRQGYDVAVNDAEKSQIILKALGAVYIDGVSGADTNDGTAPKKSVKTLKKAYELLKAKNGGVLYVVNTVTITDAQELTETSYKNYGTTVALTEGTVQIQRYGKPTAYGSPDWIESDTADYFNVESNANALFSVSGSGMLDLKNIQMDGHKDAVALTDSLAYKTNAGAIKATAPLIQVNGGKLNLGEGAVLQNNKNTTAPGSTTSTTGNVLGGAVYNSGTMNITGGVVKGNECKGTARSYTTTGEAAETVTVTPDASGIWQAGKMNVNVSDTAKLTWDVDQYIYLAEQSYDSNVTEQADKDAKVSFLNVQALPTDQVLPLDLNRDGASTGSGSTGSAAGWFAPGRKVVEMSTEGMVTADNFKVNSDSYVGSWLEGTLTEKLILAERQGTTTILELQRGAKDCIVDVIVPIKAEANSTKEINNRSKKDITVSGAGNATTIPARSKAPVTINGTLSDENRIKISCSDGK